MRNLACRETSSQRFFAQGLHYRSDVDASMAGQARLGEHAVRP